MLLNNLLVGIKHIKNNNFNPEISSLTCNSKNVKPGSLFACLEGTKFDGHKFASLAVKSGAAAILTQKNLNLPNQIIVANSHLAYSQMCANFYDNPAKKLKLIGVTGTNGKTSVTHIIKHILTQFNLKTGLIGTIRNEINNQKIESDLTTPNPKEFQKLLRMMVDNGCEFVVMEVSSHALNQFRLADVNFEIGIFTNLTQDHLDYHETMENYFNAKKKLFEKCNSAIIQIDNPYGEKLTQTINCPYHTYSTTNSKASFYAKNITNSVSGISYSLVGNSIEGQICFSTPGLFSAYNSMAAAICCIKLGLNFNSISNFIKTCPPIAGRSEILKINAPFTIICDYAHTPSGLKNILTSINSFKTGRLIAVFGCGGDRDSIKRPLMGEIAALNSDYVIITSDNPRTEDPDQIISEILIGVKKTKTPYTKITNRIEAIKFAILNARSNDVILLAGKGHETYQIIGTKKIHMDEREIVDQIMNDLH